MVPAVNAALIKTSVSGSSISWGLVIEKSVNTGCMKGVSKRVSGSVKAARKGSTAPRLKISAKAVMIDSIKRATN